MLTKLMKYDFKALNRYLILIHAFLLAAAAAVRTVSYTHLTLPTIA